MSNRTGGFGPEDRVERAAAALRQSPAPAGPAEALIERTISRLGAGEISGLQPRKEWWNMRAVRRSAIAAGVMVVAAMGILWLLLGRGAGVTFADVLEQVRQAKALRCAVEAEVEDPGRGVNHTSGELLMVDPGWVVSTFGDMVQIMKGRDGVVLLKSQKRAIIVSGETAAKRALIVSGGTAVKMQQEMGLLDQLRNLPTSGEKSLGQKAVDGVAAKGFEVMTPSGRMEVWANDKTGRPVAVVIEVTNAFIPQTKLRFSQFDWDPKYDPAELTLTPPADYEVSQISIAGPTEASLAPMLATFADLNDGAFPDHMTVREMSAGLAKRVVARGGKMDIETQMEINTLSSKIGSGWAFMADAGNGSDWHYGGKGVRLGEAGKAVLWYRPKGAENYRVIDADMKMHDAQAADLPEGETLATEWSIAPKSPATQPATGAGGGNK